MVTRRTKVREVDLRIVLKLCNGKRLELYKKLAKTMVATATQDSVLANF